MQTYRDNGAVGAYLDEYEKALDELQALLQGVSRAELTTIVDSTTQDEDCRSIQTVLSHVVRAGYTYAISIRKYQGEQIDFRVKKRLDSIAEYKLALDKVFVYTEKVFADYPDLKLEVNEVEKKMLTPWGQRYDAEQMMEHAICHVLRHRRQIERFLIKLRN